jgi:aminopeptidase-like protein
MVCLKDGSIQPLVAVEKVMFKLRRVPKKYPNLGIQALYELLQKARDVRYNYSAATFYILQSCDLISGYDHMNDIVRSVVLSSLYVNLRDSLLLILNPVVA